MLPCFVCKVLFFAACKLGAELLEEGNDPTNHYLITGYKCDLTRTILPSVFIMHTRLDEIRSVGSILHFPATTEFWVSVVRGKIMDKLSKTVYLQD